ncbi:phosphohydrolase [Actinoalloteichus sp. AHMU CJ021]|uniref:NPCBM-associated, NEW3 domain of alpha-galactosidase n=1 Tax=Actinoalloteichus caeruleus DSM 43889 TaxID=1120930 RepID=A0ABT1JMR4_ACTCY|nr:NPCBM/NEW2 domain-containing protein [Actinoalloteichus caeruleus]AUS79640.1 phosphohydrolase [Actinoalloteichus sp. AHMU CJ021]MCP2333825.1 NPCBM-associated, NEW3 domain of alpha-galactosidase [Actinoalloteichus caeruleus DSM 43889]
MRLPTRVAASGLALTATVSLAVPSAATPSDGAEGAPGVTNVSRSASAPPTTTFDVFSDIQGHLDDWDDVLADAALTNPDSVATVINGDIVDRGYDFEYEAVSEVLRAHGRDLPLLAAIGNHEAYAPAWCDQHTLCQPTWPNGFTEEGLYESFHDFAGTDSVYQELVIDDAVMLTLGTERLMWWENPNFDDQVYLSDTQLDWLRDRLAHHGRTGRPIFVFTHYPLARTVTQSDGDAGRYHLQDAELRSILGDYPQSVLFSGHTHAQVTHDRWATRVRVPGGHPDGFLAVDTAAVLNHQYLQVTTGPEGAVIRARDARTGDYPNEVRVHSVDPRDTFAVVGVRAEASTVAPGDEVVVTARLRNHGARALPQSVLRPEPPAGWEVVDQAERIVGRVGRGEDAEVSWRLRAADEPGEAAVGVTAEVRGAEVPVVVDEAEITVAAAPEGETRVSSLPFLAEENGKGPVERDSTNGAMGRGDGGPIQLDGVRYDHGLGMLAPAEVSLYAGGRCSSLNAVVGLDDAAPQGSQRRPLPVGTPAGTAVFVVLADGEEVYRSDVLRRGEAPERIEVPVEGAERLRLVVEDAGDGSAWDYADWAEATLECAGRV